MDNIDIRIIRTLAEDADVTTASMVDRLNLSIPAINKRIARLKADHIIEKTTILTNAQKVEKEITAYILIEMENFKHSEKVLDIICSDPDFLECYAVTGEFDYIVKVCAGNINNLEDKLLKMKDSGIARSQTMFALREHKFAPTALPDYK